MKMSPEKRMEKAEWGRRNRDKTREYARRWRLGNENLHRRQSRERMKRMRARRQVLLLRKSALRDRGSNPHA